jgi:hypothetical protein
MRPLSTGCAAKRPLHPWLHPDAPLGRSERMHACFSGQKHATHCVREKTREEVLGGALSTGCAAKRRFTRGDRPASLRDWKAPPLSSKT